MVRSVVERAIGKTAMAHRANNSVESINLWFPPAPPSPSESSSSSSQSSSTPKCCGHSSEFCCTRFLNQNESNFKRSASPARLMSYRNSSWLDFSSEVMDSVKSSFSERKPILEVKIEGSKVLFDFLRMVQIDFDTGMQRSIAWIDVNGNCFFPKVFLGEDNVESNTTKIELEINVSKRQREVIDKDDEVNSEDTSPAKRQRLGDFKDITADFRKWPSTRLFTGTEKEHTLVRDYFLSRIKKIDACAIITSVHQCTRASPLEKARYEVFQKQIEITKAARGTSNTVYAWYGASARGIDSILAHGFGMPSKISTHGVGIYLSHVGSPCLSTKIAEADENDEKHVILCRVILGNVEKVEAGSQQCYPSTVDFDSGSDDPKNPKWYVVWPSNMNRHILPLCVVSYKPSVPAQGKLTKFPLEKLFSKLKSALSPVKLQQVISLFRTYKAGKLPRDNFLKQLRMVAGDEMLLSTIREICASK